MEFETYPNENQDATITKTHRVALTDSSVPMVYEPDNTEPLREPEGVVAIEYKPRKRVVTEASLRQQIREVEMDELAPETLVRRVYETLSAELYPGHERYDDPWNHVPMVVSYEYGTDGQHTATLGQYR